MDKLHNSMARVTSYLLIYLTAIQPLHPAMAVGITPDNNRTQVQNQGDVPVVNIATPNDAGISHNTYQEFNVATQGTVLNNATQAAQSQLAGQLNANPNLKGKAAELIINEVTGSGRSDLQGQLEIVGNKANVMIANPNGITCDGCGFINTASATLTTGKPQFDKQGALESLEVKKGQITIGGKGLDGKTTDYVDIISRAAELNGKIQANTLSLTQGANRISLKDGTVKPIAGEGAKPQLAVDTKALGGMYANKIRLVATEKGVGVNLTNLTTTQDDISLTAEGKITLGKVHAKTDININSKAIETVAQSHVQAGQHLRLTTETLRNQGQIRAGGDVTIKATQLDNINPTKQSHPIITANKNNNITANEINNVGELSAGQNLTLTGKNFSTKAIKDSQQNIIGKLSAGGDLTAVFKEGFSFDFDKEHFKAGKRPTDLALITGKNISLTARDLANRASMRAEQNLTADAETIYLGQGNLKAGNHVVLNGKSHLDVNGYDISGRDVTLLAGRGMLSIVSGDDYTSEGIRVLTTLSADNILRIIADGPIDIADTLINRAKNIFLATNDKLEIYASGDLIDEQSPLNDSAKQELINQRLRQLSQLQADENIEIHAGKIVDLRSISLTAGKDITLTSGGILDVSKITAENPYEYSNEHGDDYEKHDEYENADDEEDEQSYSQLQLPIASSIITAGNNLTLNAGGNIIDTEATLLAKGTTAITKNNAELHSPTGRYNSVEGKYTPVTSALIARALSHAPQLTINSSEVEGEVPGIKLADKQTRITSKNNRPIIHIAAPNARGVSHNRYQEFNVGTSGLVLNNATHDTQSLLAGKIGANLNFNGKSAELIINEVVGTLASNLQGLLEVAGQKTNVFIVNPNGMTCNGCRFVNTPAVTLSTGKPVFDKDGALAALEVKKGAITLGEKGLDATAQDSIDVISRTTKLNGKLQAKNLTLTQGPNRIDFKRGTLVPIADEGYTPWNAIDTGLLGGMYANKIRLVSTEPGKAVNLTNLTATQGDISLTADGKVTLGDVQAKTDITVNGKDIDMAKKSHMQAGQHLILTTDTLQSWGRIRADGDVTIKAKTLSLDGGNITAGNQVLLQGKNSFTVRGTDISGHDITLISSGGGISVSSGGDNSTAAGTRALSTISAVNTLRILSEQGISLSDTLINRAKNIFLAGNGWVNTNQHLAADENIDLHAGGGINLDGISLTAGKDITVTSGGSINIGKVTAGNNLALIADSNITETTLSAEGATTVAQYSTALHLADGKYTPVTSALIDLALSNAPQLTINIPEIAGGIPGIQLADKRARIAVRNNLPIIHIAEPNSQGISHNRYREFNVGAAGLVLNNATEASQSVLVGQIGANPNFNGKSAELIINEVVGTLASNLQGLLEVVGRKAPVFIANPNGITCHGCGFINTPAVTLSTGNPVFDKEGALAALEVKKGTITFDEKGLDATAQDDVDIISRATVLNGKVQAKNLTLTQGSNRIDFKHGTLVPIAGEGNTPWNAIDTGSLGGMYANKIRLVSTEAGKKVNLTNLTATQGDISLTADGKVTLGDVQAKTDITVSSKDIKTAEQSHVQAGKDITLAANTLNNTGKIIAEGDMRLFIDHLYNQNKGLIQANNHLWLQKDASGNLSTEINNTSATLKTNSGDIIIRTKALNNDRDASVAAGMNAYINATKLDNSQSQFHAKKNLILTGHDFNHGMDGKLSADLNVVADFINQFNGTAFILAKNILLHAGEIINIGHLKADNDLSVIAERRMNARQNTLEAKRNLTLIAGKDIEAFQVGLKGENIELLTHEGDIRMWGDGSRISASDNLRIFADHKLDLYDLLFDKSNTITLNAGHEIDVSQIKLAAQKNLTLIAGKGITARETGLKGENIELLAREGDIRLPMGVEDSSHISANNNVQMFASNKLDLQGVLFDKANTMTLNAGHEINADRVKLVANKNLTLIAGKDITARQAELKGENVELLVREGDIQMGRNRPYELLASISADNHLRISAGNDLDLSGTRLDKSHNLTLSAGRNLNASRSQLNAAGNINLFAGNDLMLRQASIRAGQQVMLSAGRDIDISRPNTPESLFYLSELDGLDKFSELGTQITAGDHLQLSAGEDIAGIARLTSTKGNVSVNAGRDLLFSARKYSPINDGDKQYLYAASAINAAQNLTLVAAGNLLTSGASLTSGSDMQLSAGGNVRFESRQEFIREGNIERFTQHASRLNSGGALTIRSQGSILFQATELIAKGVMDIAATGGFLYAQAMEEVYRREETEKSCKGLGPIKSCKVFGSKTEHKIQIKKTNKVTEFTAGGDINLMAKDEVTLEASRIETSKNAKITSQTGKVNFKAMPNIDFEQTITTSKGFFITQRDKGHREESWIIPSVHVGGTLTVDAAKGINADVKVKEGQLLEDALGVLGNTPGTEWLKNLQGRNDVQWNQVKDAYSSWDKKSESLNPVVGAVIAIAVAAVTAGSGLAAWAGSGAVGATGATGATASAVYGAAYGGMIGLTSQAAVALVENKGDLTKTLAALAKREAVKSLVTQIAVGGALGGLDHTMGWGKLVEGKGVVDPIKAQLPLLSNQNWSQVAQRVATQSIVSSTIGTAINGGSFTDNLQTALLSNIGNQINAEGAKLIGDNGEILGHSGKILSHAVVAGISAEIAGGDAKGAAVGALAAELAAITMESRLFEPAYKNETERQIHKLQEALTGNEAKAQTAKFIGALSGALISHTPEGAYSAANSAELVYRNNMTEHMLYQLSVDNQKDILAAGKGDKAAEERVIARRNAAIAVTAVAAGGYALVYGGQILIAGSAEIATAGRVALEGCKTNPALCLNNVGIFVADAVAPEAAVGTGVLAAGTVKVLGSTKEGAKDLAEGLSHTSKPLLKNAKPDTDAVASLVKNVSTKETIAPKVTAKLEVNEKQGTKGLPTPQGLSKEIHLGQQGKHIIGHNNYIPGRSPLAEGVDPQKLLNGVHSGEYPIIRMTPRNQPIVNFGKPIGKYEGQPTNYGIIHYGKNGAHIVPANPIQH
ncbi:filamentous hemagglutinin N-terminal domain-containing protein [Photorhabdus noenieputensis]|uniref:two-partner secretion domain-containing protein n=1 Tax=Photorhabdus noenieputensis TaxID=1208607 RepID=UPI001BD591CA|nr:filamentous hemagglutinin N-terminal domain-containing protein [Photorhabdus noenieputensis]MBS9435793.1 filamentous hemagglutinin N-terminal domain-containing protein [Photorhabdus noenieputensis]MCK3667646.1 filamentous hemagglutinin N-terminal domain-containing protein [Photorhabdus noenieputensis]